jgi:hypothetical protein
MRPPQVARPNMIDAEWQARCDLAALYRITDFYGWTDTIDTHMTVRIPGEPKCFLINNYGDSVHEITASSPGEDGHRRQVYSDEGKFNAAASPSTAGVYKAKPDANCVMHTHTRAGAGVSVLKQGLRTDHPGRALGLRRPRLSRVRHADLAGGMRCAGRQLPARQLGRAAQPRPAHGRRHHSGRAAPHVHARARLRGRGHRPRASDEEPAPIDPDVIRSTASAPSSNAPIRNTA